MDRELDGEADIAVTASDSDKEEVEEEYGKASLLLPYINDEVHVMI